MGHHSCLWYFPLRTMFAHFIAYQECYFQTWHLFLVSITSNWLKEWEFNRKHMNS